MISSETMALSKHSRRQVDLATRDLVLTNDQLDKVSSILLNEFSLGLSRDTHPTANLKMLPTYVRDVPNGREKGRFLALDLGGTNFRVLLVELDGQHSKMDNQIYALPHHVMLGSGEQLFDHITDCLAQFIAERRLTGEKLPLGFTFSFPCRQEGLTRSRLVQWTKGFACAGAEGQDVVQMLRRAITKRSDVHIDVMAVLNDTTGTLMSCAHKSADCRVGVIVGTGFNFCYVEDVNNVELCHEEERADSQPKQMIINTEVGAFGDNGVLDFLKTQWDKDVDEDSLNTGRQTFEKMISGMYLGELVRRVVEDLTRRGLMLNGQGSDRLSTPNSFTSEFVSRIDVYGPEEGFVQTRQVMADMDLSHADEDDLWALKLVCQRVSTRSAHLVAACVATLLNKMKRSHTTVGVDGSVYRYHPRYHQLMVDKISELTAPEFRFDLMLSEDGSGRGAALVAAVAVRQMEDSDRS